MASDVTLNDDNSVTVTGSFQVIDPLSLITGGGGSRWAMIHANPDLLFINAGSSYTAGVRIDGPVALNEGVAIDGGLTVSDGTIVIKRRDAPSGSTDYTRGPGTTGPGDLSGVFGGSSSATSGTPSFGPPTLAKSVFEPFHHYDPDQVDLLQEVIRLRRAITMLEGAVSYLLSR